MRANLLSLTLLMSLAILLAGCGALTPIIDHQPGDPDVKMEVLSKTVIYKGEEDGPGYKIRVRFYLWSDRKWVIQEGYVDGDGLVECFKMPFPPLRVDVHFASKTTHDERIFLVYPGDVVGADLHAGYFAMLPENEDGSIKTTTGPRFNEEYLKDHKIQGRVINSQKDRGFIWKIHFDGEDLRLEIPKDRLVR